MVPEVGLESRARIDNTQVIDFAIRTMSMIRPPRGFEGQKWGQGEKVGKMGTMSSEHLSDGEEASIRQCVTAIIDGPFIEDWEFHTRLGVERAEFRAALPPDGNLDLFSDDPGVNLIVNNSLNEVANGLGISPAQWNEWFTVTREDIRRVFDRWLELCTRRRSGLK